MARRRLCDRTRKSSLDDPSTGRHDETFDVDRALDDFEPEPRRSSDGVFDLIGVVARVGPYEFKPGKASPDPVENGTDKLAGVLSRLEQRRCRLEQPRDPRSMGWFRRLVREALPKIAVENGGPNLKQKMSAPL